MSLNKQTIELIKGEEGLRLKAYPDPGSVNGLPVTIGYGTTKINGNPIKLGTTITEKQAETYLAVDLERVAANVLKLVAVALNDSQLGALTSFTYNIGLQAFKDSTLLRKLNAGDYKAVPAQMRRWNKNDGKVMQGLINRREKEIKLWNSGGSPVEATEKPVETVKPPVGDSPSQKAPITLLASLIAFIKLLFKRS